MSLHWYIGERPKDLIFIDDVEAYLMPRSFEDTEFTRKVLRELEHGEFKDSRYYLHDGGWNGMMETTCTSTKILLSIAYNPDRLINGAELGWNGYDYLPLLTEGNIYFDEFNHRLSPVQHPVDMWVNGKTVHTIEQFNEEVERIADNRVIQADTIKLEQMQALSLEQMHIF